MDSDGIQQDEEPTNSISSLLKKKPTTIERAKAAFKDNYPEALCVCFIFWQQYTFYPGLTFKTPLTFIPHKWQAITVVTVHSIFDTLGRQLAGISFLYRPVYSRKALVILTASRLIFVLFYLLMLLGVYKADWFNFLNLIFFALTCGFYSTLAANLGTDGMKDASMAGSIVGFMLILGICLGSFTSTIISHLK